MVMAASMHLFPATTEPRSGNEVLSPTSPDSDYTAVEKPSGPLSRVWEPPPRPKPGRKPATDTPPSKRKAQNRQAQRNFRERRAQKISELEDVMSLAQKRHETEADHLRNQVSHYQRLVTEMETQRGRLEEELIREKDARIAAEQQLSRAESLLLDQKGVVPLRPRSQVKSKPSHRPSLGQSDTDGQTQVVSTSNCGSKCSSANCMCVESLIIQTPDETKTNKFDESRTDVNEIISTAQSSRDDMSHQAETAMEIDMTTRPEIGLPKIHSFSSSSDSAGLLATSGPAFENCGFCENSNVCPCREFQESAQRSSLSIESPTALISESRPAARSGCSGNPGSCSQCQSDPLSKEFCVSFAKQTETSGAVSSPTGRRGCGVSDCCQSRQQTSHVRSGSNSQHLGGNSGGSSMDCATAYNRLKTHPRFDEAMANKEEWIRKLRPISTACEVGNGLPPISVPNITPAASSLEGRSAYEIDAASVMATFRHFDTRFGTDSRNDWKKEDMSKR